MISLKNILFVGLGGACGAMLRFAISAAFPQNNFPVHTILINVIGSFLLGMLTAVVLKEQSFPEATKLLLGAGFCGGFTTFSAFSIENMQLIMNGKLFISMLYISASVTGCILASLIGYKLIVK